ncbi:hypothetical protein [Zoogloea sp.]|uniref:hypothetical protein n=1 Tax=Zoogloea sp. TaxID=49181 RepID=UPI001416ADE4|nr:MAG: hypothetical protein F9K15_17265 [Zoogloea sp.]
MPIQPPKEGSIYRMADGTRLLVLTVMLDDESDFFTVEVIEPQAKDDMGAPSIELTDDEWDEMPKTLELSAG